MFRECAHGRVFGMGCDICVAKTSDPPPMTDQLKPRVREPLDEMDISVIEDPGIRVTGLRTLTLELNKSLRAALAEVEDYKQGAKEDEDKLVRFAEEIQALKAQIKDLQRLHDSNLERWQVSEQTFVTKHEADIRAQLAYKDATIKRLQEAYLPGNWEKLAEMKEQLAEVTKEKDEASAMLKRNMGLLESAEGALRSLRTALLAASAENVKLRDALKDIESLEPRSGDPAEIRCWDRVTARAALASSPSELTAALMEMVKALRYCAQADTSGLHSVKWTALGALAKYDAALGGKS